jgi:hypothetical protein
MVAYQIHCEYHLNEEGFGMVPWTLNILPEVDGWIERC